MYVIMNVLYRYDVKINVRYSVSFVFLGKLISEQIKVGYFVLKIIDICIEKGDFGRKFIDVCSDFYIRILYDFGYEINGFFCGFLICLFFKNGLYNIFEV